jgi:hypothetical protein
MHGPWAALPGTMQPATCWAGRKRGLPSLRHGARPRPLGRGVYVKLGSQHSAGAGRRGEDGQAGDQRPAYLSAARWRSTCHPRCCGADHPGGSGAGVGLTAMTAETETPSSPPACTALPEVAASQSILPLDPSFAGLPGDWGYQAATTACGSGSLAGWNLCPKPEPSVPL